MRLPLVISGLAFSAACAAFNDEGACFHTGEPQVLTLLAPWVASLEKRLRARMFHRAAASRPLQTCDFTLIGVWPILSS